MEDKKQRISLFLDKDFVVKMDKEISRQALNREMILLPMRSIRILQTSFCRMKISVVNEKLAKEIAKAGEEQQKRISKGLFRYAVELEADYENTLPTKNIFQRKDLKK